MGVDFGAAEFVLAHGFAEAALDHGRAGHEQLAAVFHHQREMGNRRAHRAESRDRTHAGANHRHMAHQFHRRVESMQRGDIRIANQLDRLDTASAAAAVYEADQRQAHFQGVFLAVTGLVADLGVGRAAAHGEVVAADDHAPAIDFRRAKHEIGRRERLALARIVVLRAAGDGADLVKTACVHQPVDAFAHRQAIIVVLALDALGSAHLPGDGFPLAQFVDFLLPGHRGQCSATIFMQVCNISPPGFTYRFRREAAAPDFGTRTYSRSAVVYSANKSATGNLRSPE